MVKGQRADQVRSSGKGHQADPVIGPFLDKFCHHRLNNIQPVCRPAVQGEIQGLHGAGYINGQQNINAGGLHLGGGIAPLGPGHGRDDQADRQQPNQAQQPARMRLPAAGNGPGNGDGGEEQGRGRSPPAA